VGRRGQGDPNGRERAHAPLPRASLSQPWSRASPSLALTASVSVPGARRERRRRFGFASEVEERLWWSGCGGGVGGRCGCERLR
jgi:hypothetical protein